MQEFEDWRSKAELPFLSNIDRKAQENRKAYKYQNYKLINITIFYK